MWQFGFYPKKRYGEGLVHYCPKCGTIMTSQIMYRYYQAYMEYSCPICGHKENDYNLSHDIPWRCPIEREDNGTGYRYTNSTEPLKREQWAQDCVTHSNTQSNAMQY